MRTCVDTRTGEVLQADPPPEKSRLHSLRCRNPKCNERVAYVHGQTVTPHFRHAPGVADLNSCFYSWDKPTEWQDASIATVEAWLRAQFPEVPMSLEEWVADVPWPLDIILTHGDGRRWGFWYVSTKRHKVTGDLIAQCRKAGIHLVVFTHAELRQPRDIFAVDSQVAFAVDPGAGVLSTHAASGPISGWRLDEHGELVAPMNQPPHVEMPAVQIDPQRTSTGQWGPFGVPEDLWQTQVLDYFAATYLSAGESFPVYKVAQYIAEKGWLSAGHQWQETEVLQEALRLWKREEERGLVQVIRGRSVWTVHPRAPKLI